MTAIESGADIVTLDAIGVEDGETLRKLLSDFNQTLAESKPLDIQKFFIQLDCRASEERLAELLGELIVPDSHLSGVFLRNVESAEDVVRFDRLVSDVEEKTVISRRLVFSPVVESPAAFFAALDIARASSRNVALVAVANGYAGKRGSSRQGRDHTSIVYKARE